MNIRKSTLSKEKLDLNIKGLSLNRTQHSAVRIVTQSPLLQDILIKNNKRLDFILSLNDEILETLSEEPIQQHISDGTLTLKKAMELTSNQHFAICKIARSPWLQEMLEKNEKGLDFILSLRCEELFNLEKVSTRFGLRQFFSGEKIDLIRSLGHEQILKLLNVDSRLSVLALLTLLAEEELDFILSLDNNQLLIIEQLHAHITGGTLTLKQVLNLSNHSDQAACIELILKGFLSEDSPLKKLNNNKLFDPSLIKIIGKMIGPDPGCPFKDRTVVPCKLFQIF